MKHVILSEYRHGCKSMAKQLLYEIFFFHGILCRKRGIKASENTPIEIAFLNVDLKEIGDMNSYEFFNINIAFDIQSSLNNIGTFLSV